MLVDAKADLLMADDVRQRGAAAEGLSLSRLTGRDGHARRLRVEHVSTALPSVIPHTWRNR